MLLVTIEESGQDLFDIICQVITYFGCTIGDNSAKVVTCGSLRVPCYDDPWAMLAGTRRVIDSCDVDGLGFSLTLSLPKSQFSICGWKVKDLIRSVRTILRLSKSYAGASVSLETMYAIVGRMIWVRCNSYVYLPHIGVLHKAQCAMVDGNISAWKVHHEDAFCRTCVFIFRFLSKPWPFVHPETILLEQKECCYTDATTIRGAGWKPNSPILWSMEFL